ncbi:MAG: 4a-hydroxytetrahydrobiopterin dehydratase [Desulfobacteraceae bacterium]|jgi:4a-hydroxytetrahydrobiopterin dehydratase
MEILTKKRCIPCEAGAIPFTEEQSLDMKKNIHSDWNLTHDNTRIERVFRFKNFKNAMNLAVLVGDLAEQENHHPDLHVSWGKLIVEITTHKIKGLVESDFVLAAKVDAVYEDVVRNVSPVQ